MKNGLNGAVEKRHPEAGLIHRELLYSTYDLHTRGGVGLGWAARGSAHLCILLPRALETEIKYILSKQCDRKDSLLVVLAKVHTGG